MAHPEAESEPASSAPNGIVRLTRAIALGGGLLTLGIAMLVTASVIGRRIWGQPVPGDFEFVQMATAVTLFAFLPLCQSHRGNIAVDTFTSRLPRAWQRWLDGAVGPRLCGFHDHDFRRVVPGRVRSSRLRHDHDGAGPAHLAGHRDQRAAVRRSWRWWR